MKRKTWDLSFGRVRLNVKGLRMYGLLFGSRFYGLVLARPV